MRCPLCVTAGAAHSMHVDNGRPPSPMRAEEFWDEKDKQHIHDPNRYVMHLHCSNRHNFVITHLARCPVHACEWNKQPEVAGGVGWPDVAKPETAS